ncbi:hypothetical protein Taro_034556 [Colocasia esculenta]|uniref:Uncharacterized protein n=1 Tax=Colocasia esculenta TaxID=4460 RepID=A0A843VWQ5_COLES|nr:hypothetical protein [Colocasia esculenta]
MGCHLTWDVFVPSSFCGGFYQYEQHPHSFAHIIYGQPSDGHCRHRFHLHPRLPRRRSLTINVNTEVVLVEIQINIDVSESDVMTQRDEVTGLLCSGYYYPPHNVQNKIKKTESTLRTLLRMRRKGLLEHTVAAARGTFTREDLLKAVEILAAAEAGVAA